MTWSPLRLSLAIFGLALPDASRAAESYDNCTGFIDTLPATITAQGTWCLRKHLYTSQASGPAISVLTDNVTLDCNDHRLSGFGAGIATEAVGINTGPSRAGVTVRKCRIQGFKHGVVLHGARHLVEDNRFEGNTFTGIHVSGTGLVIRNNLVNDTGGRPNEGTAQGIHAGEGRVVGNTITGVSPDSDANGNKFPVGIHFVQGLVEGNRINGLVTTGSQGFATGIRLDGTAVARDNTLIQAAGIQGYGVFGSGLTRCFVRDTDMRGYELGAFNCVVAENTAQ